MSREIFGRRESVGLAEAVERRPTPSGLPATGTSTTIPGHVTTVTIKPLLALPY